MVNKILKTWNKILSRIFSGKTIHKSGNKILFHPLKNLFHGLQILLAILFYSSENFVRMASKNFVPWPPKFRSQIRSTAPKILFAWPLKNLFHGLQNFVRDFVHGPGAYCKMGFRMGGQFFQGDPQT